MRSQPAKLAQGPGNSNLLTVIGNEDLQPGESLTFDSDNTLRSNILGSTFDPKAGKVLGSTIVWGSSVTSDTIVWGRHCNLGHYRVGQRCSRNHRVGQRTRGHDRMGIRGALDTIVWGSAAAGTIVWGSSTVTGDTIVWGSRASDTIVWVVAIPTPSFGAVRPMLTRSSGDVGQTRRYWQIEKPSSFD